MRLVVFAFACVFSCIFVVFVYVCVFAFKNCTCVRRFSCSASVFGCVFVSVCV